MEFSFRHATWVVVAEACHRVRCTRWSPGMVVAGLASAMPGDAGPVQPTKKVGMHL